MPASYFMSQRQSGVVGTVLDLISQDFCIDKVIEPHERGPESIRENDHEQVKAKYHVYPVKQLLVPGAGSWIGAWHNI